MSKPETTRDRLLQETAWLVQKQGFGSTSVNDILQAAGVPKGTLYHYFRGKEELGLAVLRRDREAFLAFLDSALAAPTPREALDRLFRAALRKHRNAGFVGGCLWGNTALETSDSRPAYAASVREVFEEWVSRIERVIRSGQEAGQIRADLPASDLARLVVAGIEGGIMMSRLTKRDGPLRACVESLRVLLAQGTTLAATNASP